MSSDMFHQWAFTLSRVSRNDPSLKWIDAMCFLMGNDGARLLADALQTNSYVTKINLRLNHIGVEGIEALVDVLENNHTVTELNLAANELGDEGALHIARLIKKTRSLAKLTLMRCNITSIGTQVIATSLLSNSSLTWLNISDNDQGTNYEGVDGIIDALRQNTNLKFLKITTLDAARSKQVSELSELNSKIGSWDKNFRKTLLRADGSDDGDVSFFMYPDALSKFADIPGAIGVLFDLVKESQSSIFHADDEHQCCSENDLKRMKVTP